MKQKRAHAILGVGVLPLGWRGENLETWAYLVLEASLGTVWRSLLLFQKYLHHYSKNFIFPRMHYYSIVCGRFHCLIDGDSSCEWVVICYPRMHYCSIVCGRFHCLIDGGPCCEWVVICYPLLMVLH